MDAASPGIPIQPGWDTRLEVGRATRWWSTQRGAVDYMDYGLALGRRFRALKLWFVMRYFGREGLVAVLRRSLEMAAWLGQRISASARFELVAPVNMGLVCFQLRQGDDATRDLMRRINDTDR